MPETRERLIETFGEVAERLGYSESWVRELWKRYGFRLQHRLRPRGRIRMTREEFERFKERVSEAV